MIIDFLWADTERTDTDHSEIPCDALVVAVRRVSKHLPRAISEKAHKVLQL